MSEIQRGAAGIEQSAARRCHRQAQFQSTGNAAGSRPSLTLDQERGYASLVQAGVSLPAGGAFGRDGNDWTMSRPEGTIRCDTRSFEPGFDGWSVTATTEGPGIVNCRATRKVGGREDIMALHNNWKGYFSVKAEGRKGKWPETLVNVPGKRGNRMEWTITAEANGVRMWFTLDKSALDELANAGAYEWSLGDTEDTGRGNGITLLGHDSGTRSVRLGACAGIHTLFDVATLVMALNDLRPALQSSLECRSVVMVPTTHPTAASGKCHPPMPQGISPILAASDLFQTFRDTLLMTPTHFHRSLISASRIAGLLAVAAGLATALPASASASGPSAALKAKFPEVTGIASQLTAGGTARVMVLLKAKTPASPDPNPGYEKTTATRDLASTNKTARYYPKVALFAATAKLAELEKLAADSVVLKMQLDHVNARSTVAEETVDQSAATVGVGPAFLAGFDGTGQAIAVLDTGFQVDHPFFADKLIDEACFSNGDLLAGNASLCAAANAPHPAINCDPALDGCNHGTLVAGVAVGRLPDNIQLTDKASRTGVGRGAKLIAVNVFTKVPNAQINGGYGLQAYDSDVIAALLWVDGKKDSYGATKIAAVNLSMAFGSLDGT
eukprot:gene19880-20383_t